MSMQHRDSRLQDKPEHVRLAQEVQILPSTKLSTHAQSHSTKSQRRNPSLILDKKKDEGKT